MVHESAGYHDGYGEDHHCCSQDETNLLLHKFLRAETFRHEPTYKYIAQQSGNDDVEEYELQNNKIKIFDLESIRNKTVEKVNQMSISEVKQQLVDLDRYRTGLSETELRKILVGALMEKALKSSLGGNFR